MTAEYRNREWFPQPQAEAALRAVLGDMLARNAAAGAYATRLLDAAGVRLRDIVDHVVVGSSDLARLEAAGWADRGDGVFANAHGLFPEALPGASAIWFRVESIERFVAATGVSAPIEGAAHGPLRRAMAFPGAVGVGAIERAGEIGFDVPEVSAKRIHDARLRLNAFRARRRQFDTVEAGLAHTEALVDAAVGDLGQHWACDLWFRAERDYWMSRCPAGRLQKARQDAAGIGWSNIDHHTYDGSREHFRHTVRILEKMGYQLREMLYAGEMAGWGSQVLEQPASKSTIFADVDLAPHETDIDFAHEELPPLKLRRAGILSILHGESILEGGLNHVAALYEQRTLRAQLGGHGLSMMKPFSDFAFLYQELTEGDVAAVDPARVDRLERAGDLTAAEAETIRLNGYIAAHLENIERNDGYKGFNKPGIDGVLRALDPRASVRAEAA